MGSYKSKREQPQYEPPKRRSVNELFWMGFGSEGVRFSRTPDKVEKPDERGKVK